MDEPITLHATCVAIRGIAVVIVGASGTGKSDLALRLIDRGAMLVSDDYTILTPTPCGLIATPPATIAGKLEIRGIGIVEMPHVESAPVGLLVAFGAAERMPPPSHRTVAGISIPDMIVSPFEASTPIKIERALTGTPV